MSALPDPRTHDVQSGEARRVTVHLEGEALPFAIYFDIPATLPIGNLANACRALSTGSRQRRPGPFLWILEDGAMVQLDLLAGAKIPIGERLEAEQMHIVRLSYEAPPLRGQ